MPANVDTMMSVRQVPWHGLGTIVQNAQLSEEAIKTAGLDWTVEMRPVLAQLGDNSFAPAQNFRATVRTDTKHVLGIVSPKYQIVQNAEAFQFMDDIAGAGRLLQYETAGALHYGAKVWMLATVKDLCMEPVKGDIVQPYLLLANGHDGRFELSISWTSVRVVCQNTLNLALQNARTKFSVRHTRNLGDRKEAARQILGLTSEVVKANEDVLKRLAQKQLGDKLLDEFLLNLIPNSEDPEANNTRAENVREAIRTQYESAPGQDLTGVKGTAWGALNAVTSYTSFEKTVRKETAERRLESVWWGSAAALNKRATDLLLEMA